MSVGINATTIRAPGASVSIVIGRDRLVSGGRAQGLEELEDEAVLVEPVGMIHEHHIRTAR
jgi:hypothetical protein